VRVNFTIPLLLVAAMAPATAHAQCVRMLGSNQIVCPGYANSTPPVYPGPGGYVPGRGMLGVGQMVYGTGMAGLNARKGNSVGMQYNAATAANGYYNATNYPMLTYRPRIAVPAQRPSGYRW
jgi:hypothetical protein